MPLVLPLAARLVVAASEPSASARCASPNARWTAASAVAPAAAATTAHRGSAAALVAAVEPRGAVATVIVAPDVVLSRPVHVAAVGLGQRSHWAHRLLRRLIWIRRRAIYQQSVLQTTVLLATISDLTRYYRCEFLLLHRRKFQLPKKVR